MEKDCTVEPTVQFVSRASCKLICWCLTFTEKRSHGLQYVEPGWFGLWPISSTRVYYIVSCPLPSSVPS